MSKTIDPVMRETISTHGKRGVTGSGEAGPGGRIYIFRHFASGRVGVGEINGAAITD